MAKQDILNNVDSLTAEQLFNCINRGDVTLDELRNTGNLDATKRRAIQTLQAKREQEDDALWERSCNGNEVILADYISQYPAGRHVEEANNRIEDLRQQRQQAQSKRQEILDKLQHNCNSYTPEMIRNYLNNGTITRENLHNFGIPPAVIDCLNNIATPQLELGQTPKAIPEGYTEVYFWGIPGSGKTCALAAILNTAEKLGLLEIAEGPGYDYMVLLKNTFANPISFLPGGSPIDTTQYLPFTLKREEEKFARSVSLIELSGEIFNCFLYVNANRPFPTLQHENTFNSLISFLNGKNRKIHFFFVDYERENNIDNAGYQQSDYLNAAATFFNNKKYNIFNKTTDAIYIVITKSDLMPCEKHERVEHIKQYLDNNNFAAFVNSLRAKCREHSINGNRILGTPFALGSVYFQHICMFDDETARNIIDILMRRIAPTKKSILDILNQ
jgi:hypothetical protein